MKETSWSDRIRDARAARDITLDAVAEACGVSRPTVIDWEKGVGPGPRLESIPALCAALGITPHWLIFGREKGEPRDKLPPVTGWRHSSGKR